MKIFSILFLILFGLSSQAQIKQWTLPECVAYALENNITIKQSELNLEETLINKKDAIGNFFPTLNGSVSHSWSKGLSQDPVTFDAVSATAKTLYGNVSSNITIFNGLRNLNQLHRSNLQILASQYQMDDIKDDISLLIANSFLQILL
jgi:outer membrane protein